MLSSSPEIMVTLFEDIIRGLLLSVVEALAHPLPILKHFGLDMGQVVGIRMRPPHLTLFEAYSR